MFRSQFLLMSLMTTLLCLHEINAQVQCGGNLTLANGSIRTPSFPNPPHPLDCTWVIRVASTSVVRLEFLTFSTSGLTDFVSVHDGDSVDDRFLLQYSGGSIPASTPIRSTNNSMAIRFVTGNKYTGTQGFEANYYTVPKTACGYTFQNATYGEFQSPNHPANYDSNSHCIWSINTGNTSYALQFDFRNFTSELNYDVLEIFDGNSEAFPIKARLSGNIPNATQVITSGSMAYVKFDTDFTTNNIGFSASYTFIPKPGMQEEDEPADELLDGEGPVDVDAQPQLRGEEE